MSARKIRPKTGQQLKSYFAVGGIVTTLLAANFLANSDQPSGAAPDTQVVNIDTTGNPYLDNSGPIQQLSIPQPVARSRSS